MGRAARDERLDARAARLRLKPRREPYWRNIQMGRAIGYRRLAGGKAGTWIARFFERDANPRRQYQALGSADDLLDADGISTLSFVQAQERARAWFAELMRASDHAPPPPLTVAAAITNYLADYRARGGKALREMQTTFAAHVLPKFGKRRVAEIEAASIRAWHQALAEAPARTRGKPRAIAEDDADGKRARRSTANNVLTLLKAALNLAYREGRVATDDAWRRVRPFQNASAARVRYLRDDEATRLMNACPGDLRALVTAALLTGCRYQELARLRPADLDLKARVLTVAIAKAGIPRHVVLTDEAARFFERQAAGKAADAILLPRGNGEPWAKSEQFRPLRAACEAAAIRPAIGFHILRHSHASRLARAGVPMAVIAAQLGHSSVKITEQHYAHLSPGYVAETIRAAFGTMGLPEAEVKVRAIRD